MTHKRLTLFAGHYGSGKTNIALNYARWLRRKGEAVTVADLAVCWTSAETTAERWHWGAMFRRSGRRVIMRCCSSSTGPGR